MNTNKDDNGLQDMVNNIANDISEGIELNKSNHEHILDETGQDEGDMMYASDYLSDVLDIQYIVSSSREYLGARVLVAFGGPNIWINTQSGIVEGYWWWDTAFASFNDEIDLDDFLSELWDCGA